MRKLLILIVIFGAALMTVTAQEGKSDSVSLSGTVIDSAKKPIRGAVIYLDSVNSGVRTNELGEFSLLIPTKTILISTYSKDYGVTDIRYDGGATIDFQLKKKDKRMSKNDVKALGYRNNQTSNKRQRKAKSKDYTKYRDIYQLLVAEFPGVQANGRSIQLRGTSVSSVNSGTEPLYIVDGTVVGSIGFVSPFDVKSVKVIRDESASLYGSRGANGVIIIELNK